MAPTTETRRQRGISCPHCGALVLDGAGDDHHGQRRHGSSEAQPIEGLSEFPLRSQVLLLFCGCRAGRFQPTSLLRAGPGPHPILGDSGAQDRGADRECVAPKDKGQGPVRSKATGATEKVCPAPTRAVDAHRTAGLATFAPPALDTFAPQRFCAHASETKETFGYLRHYGLWSGAFGGPRARWHGHPEGGPFARVGGSDRPGALDSNPRSTDCLRIVRPRRLPPR